MPWWLQAKLQWTCGTDKKYFKMKIWFSNLKEDYFFHMFGHHIHCTSNLVKPIVVLIELNMN